MIDIKNKEVCVLGIGKSGFSASQLLVSKGARVKISESSDTPDIRKKIDILQAEDAETGGHTENFVLSSQLIVVSPGVRSDLPVLLSAKKRRILVISELELAYQLCPSKIVAVTGTNGKTTTVKLISHLLKEEFNIYEAGNLEIPFSSIVNELAPKDVVVLEVSSFQLRDILNFRPFISVILNITPDHLDMHLNMKDYIDSKIKIFSNQKNEDFAVINASDIALSKIRDRLKAQLYSFSLDSSVTKGTYLYDGNIVFAGYDNKELICEKEVFPLPGAHNMENCLAAVTVSKILGLEKAQIEKGLKNFKNLEHRLEKVGVLREIEFINDSKSTNLDCIQKALFTVQPPLFLILGGKDKGNDYSKLKDIVTGKVKMLLAIGESKEKIKKAFEGSSPIFMYNTLEEAVEFAFKNAQSGDKILLSPGCASFDMFKDYKERGEVFKQTFDKLKQVYG